MPMEYSLLIALQVSGPQERSAAVEEVIESLGEWIQVQRSLYILWTSIEPRDVHDRVRDAMEASDLLAVADIKKGFVSNYGAVLDAFSSKSLDLPPSTLQIDRGGGLGVVRAEAAAAA